jgi:predicted nucleotidyltransferase
MDTDTRYPGSPQHQALLQAIVAYYHADSRIMAVSLFGSLSRGNWDPFSDLDLDVVIGDDVQMDVLQELERLCAHLAAIGQHDAIIVADGNDAGDVVFVSLAWFSIRYHPLATTSPNIVDSLQVLTGRLDCATIAAAGRANPRSDDNSFPGLLDKCVRYIVGADVAVQRGQVWGAVELLHRIRAGLMDLYALAHGGRRPLQTFQAEADGELQARLGGALPQLDRASVQRSLARCLDILEQDLGQFTNGQAQLSAAHQKVLAHVRARQARRMPSFHTE